MFWPCSYFKNYCIIKPTNLATGNLNNKPTKLFNKKNTTFFSVNSSSAFRIRERQNIQNHGKSFHFFLLGSFSMGNQIMLSQCFRSRFGNKNVEISLRSCFAATSDHHVVPLATANRGKASVIKPNKNRFLSSICVSFKLDISPHIGLSYSNGKNDDKKEGVP